MNHFDIHRSWYVRQIEEIKHLLTNERRTSVVHVTQEQSRGSHHLTCGLISVPHCLLAQKLPGVIDQHVRPCEQTVRFIFSQGQIYYSTPMYSPSSIVCPTYDEYSTYVVSLYLSLRSKKNMMLGVPLCQCPSLLSLRRSMILSVSLGKN